MKIMKRIALAAVVDFAAVMTTANRAEPAGRHWSDQVEPVMRRDAFCELWLDRAAVEAHLEERTELKP